MCQHDNWCLIGEKYVLCMRAESQRPKELKDGTLGWLHPIGEPERRPLPLPKPAPNPAPREVNVPALLKSWAQFTVEDELVALAKSLSLSLMSLDWMNCVRSPQAGVFAFPMCDGDGTAIGIRLRAESGKKWAYPGSRNGLFVPTCGPQPQCFVCEGPTDTAAMLTLGFYAIGRPSCSAGAQQLVDTVKRLHIKRVVIVSDCDAPGMRGAKDLQERLPVRSCIMLPPAKDIRKFVANGGTAPAVMAQVNQLVWSVRK